MTSEENWWYLSFADDNGWLGFCILKDVSGPTAIMQAHRLEINPGGEVVFIPWQMESDPPEEFTNKLFTTVEDIRRFDKAVGGEGKAISSVTGEEK